MIGFALVSLLAGEPVAGSPVAPTQAARPIVIADPRAVVLDDVVVEGRRGAASLTPEAEFGEVEIDALAAYDIAETLALIGQSLGLEDPAILVNGRRVVNARDFTRFPPDALVRVEVLPPNAAAVYGEDPARRVINIVLQRRYQSRDGQARASRPTAGGRSTLGLDGRQGAILDNRTRQLGFKLSRDTALTAAERSGASESAGRVTLRPAVDAFEINGAFNQALGDWSAALSGDLQGGRSRFVSAVDGDAVESRQTRRRLNLAGGLTGETLGWSTRLSVRGALSNVEQTGLVESRSRTVSGGSDLNLDRSIWQLPAGALTATLSGRYHGSWSTGTRAGAPLDRDAQDFSVRGGLVIPLSEAGQGPIPGDLSLTLGAAASGLLDGDGGRNLTGGVSWAPARKTRLGLQWSQSTDTPQLEARLDPVYYGPPERVYDFVAGAAVDVLPLRGGNPDLRAETSRRLSLTASAGPFFAWRLQSRVGFQSQRSEDEIGELPALTPLVEAAYSDRFIRDATGRLVVIDQRPLNLGWSRQESVSTGFNLVLPVGATATPGVPGWLIGVNHTWRTISETGLAAGLARLDHLKDGGLPRHQVTLQASGKLGAIAVNVSADWRSAARIRRTPGLNGPDDVVLAELTRIGLRLSRDFGRTTRLPSGKGGRRRYDGLRLELEVENLFDARPDAARGDGEGVPGFGRDARDPLGRTIRLSLTRRF